MEPPSAAELAFFDQERRRTVDAIRRHGVMLTHVSDSEECDCCRATNRAERRAAARAAKKRAGQTFSYTTGLHGQGHPELLVFGLSPQRAALLLNTVAHEICDHEGDLMPGEVFDVEAAGLTVRVEAVPNPGAILFAANHFYGRPPFMSVEALQLSWADRAGHFPGDPDCDAEVVREQPRPGEFAG